MVQHSGIDQVPDDWVERFWEILEPDWLAGQFRKYEKFRERYSPPSRWWHRPPKMSPIVPLFYWSMLGLEIPDDSPMGVWQGNPSRILDRLLMAIMEFIHYWDSLPQGRGRKQLRQMLRDPGRFFGFRHEVRLATHFSGSGYQVEPLFFDPASESGEADIRIDDGRSVYDVQCKARDPSKASDMPYDTYMTFAGAWSRLVLDAGRNWFLYINLKRKIDANNVFTFIERLRGLIGTGLATAGQLEEKYWDLRLIEIGSDPGMVKIDEAEELANRTGEEPLYFDTELLKQASVFGSPPHVAGCFIAGKERLGLEHYVFKTAENAAKSYKGSHPLIVSVNLYQETDMTEYMNNPRVGPIYHQWTSDFFSRHRHVAMLLISSNYDKFFRVDDTRRALTSKYLAVESPYWDDVLPDMGGNVSSLAI